MSKQTLAIVIGGFLPALLYGGAGVLQKSATKAGIGPGPYILIIGLVAAVVGGAITWIERDTDVTWEAAGYAGAFALLWSAAVFAIIVALGRYGGPISVIIPLYNTNTLIAVALGLLLFGEWDSVRPTRLLIGAVLIVAGGALAATSEK